MSKHKMVSPALLGISVPEAGFLGLNSRDVAMVTTTDK